MPNTSPRVDQMCRNAKPADSDDDDNEDITLDDEDWRAFRAKLVMGEKNSPESDDVSSNAKTSGSIENSDGYFSDSGIDSQKKKRRRLGRNWISLSRRFRGCPPK